MTSVFSVLNNIKTFGEPKDIEVIRFYEETVHQKMLENPVKIHEIIPNTFKVVLEKLDHIIQANGLVSNLTNGK